MEHDIGENVHHGVLYHIPLRNRLPCIGKDVEGGYSTQEQVWIQVGRLGEESSIYVFLTCFQVYTRKNRDLYCDLDS